MRLRTITTSLLLLMGACALQAAPPETQLPSAPALLMKNLGQVADLQGRALPEVLYRTQDAQAQVFVRANGLSYQFMQHDAQGQLLGVYRVDMDLEGASVKPVQREWASRAYRENYYLAHCPQGVLDVPGFERVRLEEVWPGIDWVIYRQEGQLKYDFILKPGADAGQIRLRYRGASGLSIEGDGSLRMTCPLGELREQAPLSFQGDKPVASRFVLAADGRLSFALGPYDRQQNLRIDPVLEWGSYFGGPGNERAHRLRNDAAFLYLCGQTSSQTGLASSVGVYQTVHGGGHDAFLSRWDFAGQRLWATYYGGAEEDAFMSVATNSIGEIWAAGHSRSQNLATTGQLQILNAPNRSSALVVKFTAGGARVWSSYFGGSEEDLARDIQVHPNTGTCYFGGTTQSADNIFFELVPQGLNQPEHNALQGGRDGFLASLDDNGGRLWSGYYGTALDDAVNALRWQNDSLFFAGHTSAGTGFFAQTLPHAGQRDGFLACVDGFTGRDGLRVTLPQMRLIGGTGNEAIRDIAIHAGRLYALGEAQSTGLAQGLAFQGAYGGGSSDGLILAMPGIDLSAAPSTVSYFGSTGEDRLVALQVDASGVYALGYTGGANLLSFNGFFNQALGTAFLVKFDAGLNQRFWATYLPGTGLLPLGGLAMSTNAVYTATTVAGNMAGPAVRQAWQPSTGGGEDAFLCRFSKNNQDFRPDTSFKAFRLCPGAVVTIPLTIYGAYNLGNTFTATLSNSSGGFAFDTTLVGSSFAPDSLRFTLPANPPASSNYRLRLRSSNPLGSVYTIEGLRIDSTCIQWQPLQNNYCRGQGLSFSLPQVAPLSTDYTWSVSSQFSGPDTLSYTSRVLDANYGNTVTASVWIVEPNRRYQIQQTSPLQRPLYADQGFMDTLDYQLCRLGDSVALRIRSLDGVACPACPVQLLDSSGNVLRSWTGLTAGFSSIFVNQPGLYAVRVVGCGLKSNQVRVRRVLLNPQIQALPNDTICVGDSATLIVSASCTNCGYAWTAASTAVTLPTPNAASVVVGANTTYQVVVSDLSGVCTATASQAIVTRAPNFTNVNYLPLATSEGPVRMDSIVGLISPIASANLPIEYSGQGITGNLASGFFFNARNLSPGLYPITARMFENGCATVQVRNIEIIAPPSLQNLNPDLTYCRSAPTAFTRRDPSYAYANLPGIQSVERNIMFANITNYPGPLINNNPNTVIEDYVYQPSLTQGSFSVITVFYRSYIYTYDALGNLINTRSYVVGSVTDTLRIIENRPVHILDRVPLYCEYDEFRRVRLSPANDSGIVYISELNASNQIVRTETFYPNSLGEIFFNPAILDAANGQNSRYLMRYLFDSAGCGGRDTFSFFLPERANRAFAPQSQAAVLVPRYCVSANPDPLVAVLSGGVYSLNNVAFTDGIFRPAVAGPGVHTVRYTVDNGFGCVYDSSRTFIVDSLPNLRFTTVSDTFCEYANSEVLNVLISPALGSGTLTLQRSLSGPSQTLTLPYTIAPAVLGLATDSLIFRYTHTDTNNCSNSIEQISRIYPRPQIQINALDSVYCATTFITIPLNPNPYRPDMPLTSSDPSLQNLIVSDQSYQPRSLTASSPGGRDTITYSYINPQTGCGDTIVQVVRVRSTAGLPVIEFDGAIDTVICAVRDTLYTSVSMPSSTLDPTRGYFTHTRAAGLDTVAGSPTVGLVPALADTGQIFINYIYDHLGGCIATTSYGIYIRSLPDVDVIYGVPIGPVNNQDTVCFSTRDSIDLNPFDRRFPPILADSIAFSGARVNGLYFRPDAPGMNYINLYYRDERGCFVNFVDSLLVLPNPAPSISGLDSIYCLNGGIDTILGIPSGGAWTSSPGNYVLGLQTIALLAPQSLTGGGGVQNNLNVNYRITQLNGCSNDTTVRVRIAAPPSLSITSPSPGQAFCSNDSLIPLRAMTNGQPWVLGRFEELGNNSGVRDDSLFVPSAGNFSRNLRYSYRDSLTGCADTVGLQLVVNRAPIAAFTANQPSPYCTDAGPQTFTNTSQVFNTGVVRTFFSVPTAPAALDTSGPQGQMDFLPLIAGLGTHQLQMIVRDGANCADTTSRTVSVVGLPQGVRILPFDSILCLNELPTPVGGFPLGSGGRFRILDTAAQVLDSATAGSSYNLNPGLYSQGFYRLVYAFTDNNGCTAYDTTHFQIHSPPRADYQQLRFCQGDTILVRNTSTYPSTLTIADTTRFSYWRYQGLLRPNFGPLLALLNEPPGWGILELVTESGAGCRDTLSGAFLNSAGRRGDTLFVYGLPSVNFLEEGGCQFDQISFNPDSTGLAATGLNNLSSVIWDFGNGDSLVLNNLGGVNLPPVTYAYSQAGVFQARLTAVNNGLCTQTASRRIVVSPTINPVTVPYSEDFDLGPGNWFQSLAQNPVWQHGLPNGDHIQAGNPVWSTGGGAPYSAGQATWVFTPCFDLSQSRRPMLKFDYFTDLYDFDGVVLEYYDRQNQNWLTLGRQGQGLNWYNNEGSIFALLNFKPFVAGINLDAFSGRSLDWAKARYRLDEFKGQNFLRLRFALGTLANVPNNAALEGFALDNFWLGERGRSVLVEHFANVFYPNMDSINQIVYRRVHDAYNGQDLQLVQIHTDQGSLIDPIHQVNSADHNARRFYYGAENAKAVLNGNAFYGNSTDIRQDYLDSLMLQDPRFSIELQPARVSAGQFEFSATIQALDTLPLQDYVAYATIVEDSVDANGAILYGVMRKFLPDHGSIRYFRTWLPGDTVRIRRFWPVNQNLYNPAKLQAVLFIQVDSTKEVLQVAATRNLNFFPSLPTSLEPVEAEQLQAQLDNVFGLQLFPNPAREQFNVSLPQVPEHDLQWEIYDLQGRLLQQAQWPQGQHQIPIQVGDLAPAMYIFRLIDTQTGASAQRQWIKS